MVNLKISFLFVGLFVLFGCAQPNIKSGKSATVLVKPPEHSFLLSQSQNDRVATSKLKRIKTESFVKSYKNCNKWYQQYGFEPSTIRTCGRIRPKGGHYPTGIKPSYKGILLERILNLKSSYFVYYKSQLDRPGAYLVIYDKKTHTIQKSFDLKNYEYPSVYHVRKAWARQSLDWAEIEDNILYISTSGGFPREVNGKTGFLTAVDLKTNAILWRSQEQKSNTSFVVTDDIIVTGYGLTAHQDYLYVLNRHNGKVIQTIPLAYAALDIKQKNNKIYVATRGYTYIFKIVK